MLGKSSWITPLNHFWQGVQTWALDREYIEEMERRRREENGGDGGVLRAILEVIILVETLRSSAFELVLHAR
jgi:hypothetical protein